VTYRSVAFSFVFFCHGEGYVADNAKGDQYEYEETEEDGAERIEQDVDEGWTRIESSGFGGMFLGSRRHALSSGIGGDGGGRARGVMDAVEAMKMITPTSCAAARLPDIDSFPSLLEHCIPDVLMTWNFLQTFERALSLTPIGLDDFVDALVYVPPEGQMGDDILAPPVYFAEVHLGLLKFLLQDKSSDDWWWSVLETNETMEAQAVDENDELAETDDEGTPPIKVDTAALLAETEDPLITTSWLVALENGAVTTKGNDLKASIKTAMKVAANKWVIAYCRKVLELIKSHGVEYSRKSVVWLTSRVRESRPELVDSSVKPDRFSKLRGKIIEEIGLLMDKLPDTTPSITEQDVIECESDDDEDSDESDDEDDKELAKS